MNDQKKRQVRSYDGVQIGYSVAGHGVPALVFIHGGLANREFWSAQLHSFAGLYQTVTVDLAGHGLSGQHRKRWTITAFGEDIRAVADALDLHRMVLIGNSLGGAVALQAAALLPGRTMGVIGVDTFHDATRTVTETEARETADRYHQDFPATCHALVDQLFHPGQHRSLRAWVETQMLLMAPEVVIGVMEGMAGYDTATAFRRAGVPIRAINGDLFPTKVAVNRRIAPDFEVVILSHTGHFPMLEQPTAFNDHLHSLVKQLEILAE